MASEEGMLRLDGSCPKATVTLLSTYQVGTMSSVGKDVEPRDLLLLLVETGTYCRECFGAMVRQCCTSYSGSRLIPGNLLCGQRD